MDMVTISLLTLEKTPSWQKIRCGCLIVSVISVYIRKLGVDASFSQGALGAY